MPRDIHARCRTPGRSSNYRCVGHHIVSEGRFLGSFLGPLTTDAGDIEPNGAVVDLPFVDVCTWADGVIAEHCRARSKRNCWGAGESDASDGVSFFSPRCGTIRSGVS
jgi:hypothetical protein